MFHLASLDAPTVAAVWALAFAWAAKVRLPWWAPLALWLAAWALYIGDRLLDARGAAGSGRTDRLRDRHHFHWRHRRVLMPLAGASAVGAAVLVFAFMPAISLERNSLLAAATVVYFTRVHTGRSAGSGSMRWPRVPKELLVGLLFTAGCALPAWTRMGATASRPFFVDVAFFAFLGWLDCQAIDGWESHGARIGQAGILWRAAALAIAGSCLAGALFSTQPRAAALLVAGAASAVLLGILDRVRRRLTPLALRAAADLVLLTPLVFLWR